MVSAPSSKTVQVPLGFASWYSLKSLLPYVQRFSLDVSFSRLPISSIIYKSVNLRGGSVSMSAAPKVCQFSVLENECWSARYIINECVKNIPVADYCQGR